jgi:putative hydrolase of the HAD superfamily
MNQHLNPPIPWNNIQTLLIDLDDTIYPQNNGLWDMIRVRINQFLVNELHFSEEEAPELRTRLWKKYGTTLRGLQVEYAVDMDAYLDFVHDVPIENAISADKKLDQLLSTLPQQKVIFTNASAAHAQRVMKILGVSRHFEAIVDIYALAPHCKPQMEAFQVALDLLQTSPESCLLIDDSPPNLSAAKALGMTTISVGSRVHEFSPHINSIHDLLGLLSP